MPFNRAAMQNPILDQPFSWKPQKMTYLGLQIPSEMIKTHQLNYTPLLKKVGEELDRWRDLPISLIGQVNCVKMNILPKFLYLFQTLPFPIPLDPSLILLGDDSVLPVNICSITRFIKLAVIAANKCTAIIWKSDTPSSKQMWLNYLPIFHLKK